MAVGDTVIVAVGMLVGVAVGAGVFVGVFVGPGVFVGVLALVGVGVLVGVVVGFFVGVGESVGSGVSVGCGVSSTVSTGVGTAYSVVVVTRLPFSPIQNDMPVISSVTPNSINKNSFFWGVISPSKSDSIYECFLCAGVEVFGFIDSIEVTPVNCQHTRT